MFLNHIICSSVQENLFKSKQTNPKTQTHKYHKKWKKWLIIFDSIGVAFRKGFNGVNWSNSFVTRYFNNAFQISCIRITLFCLTLFVPGVRRSEHPYEKNYLVLSNFAKRTLCFTEFQKFFGEVETVKLEL